MKLSRLSVAVLSASLLSMGAVAQAEEAAGPVAVTGSVAFTSDYKFRGISQGSGNAAVQGSLTATHTSGVYGTMWASSISGVASEGAEYNILLGYAGSVGDVGYDVGVMRYEYPGANDMDIQNFAGTGTVTPDYNEIYASISGSGAKLGLAYSDDYFAESGKFLYTFASYGTEVAGIGLSALVGYNKFFDDAEARNFFANGETSYIDYKVAASKAFNGVNFELAYVGTDLDTPDDVSAAADANVDGSLVFTVSKSF